MKNEVHREQNAITCDIYLKSINSIILLTEKNIRKLKELTSRPSVQESAGQ